MIFPSCKYGNRSLKRLHSRVRCKCFREGYWRICSRKGGFVSWIRDTRRAERNSEIRSVATPVSVRRPLTPLENFYISRGTRSRLDSFSTGQPRRFIDDALAKIPSGKCKKCCYGSGAVRRANQSARTETGERFGTFDRETKPERFNEGLSCTVISWISPPGPVKLKIFITRPFSERVRPTPCPGARSKRRKTP